jgi:hypothetical protein
LIISHREFYPTVPLLPWKHVSTSLAGCGWSCQTSLFSTLDRCYPRYLPLLKMWWVVECKCPNQIIFNLVCKLVLNHPLFEALSFVWLLCCRI